MELTRFSGHLEAREEGGVSRALSRSEKGMQSVGSHLHRGSRYKSLKTPPQSQGRGVGRGIIPSPARRAPFIIGLIAIQWRTLRQFVASRPALPDIYKGGPAMAKSVRMDDRFVQDAQVYANANHRSVPKQIEHWAQIGRIAEENPDLPYEFIKDALLATAELEAGDVEAYVRRKKD